MEKEIIIIKAGGSMFSKSETNLFDFELALKYKSVFNFTIINYIIAL